MHYFLKILQEEGCKLTSEDKILDLGCGNGSLVWMLRQDGFNAEGCDIRFKEGKHVTELETKGIIKKIGMPKYQLPYENGSFDYVVSETVFEHVFNTDETIAEIYRILKPGGVSLHYFPAKYGLMESHVHVPLASVLKFYPYLWFWALVGVRKERQKGLSVSTVASENQKYLLNCTNYLSTKEIRDAFGSYFPDVRFVEGTAIHHSTSRLTVLMGKYLGFLPFLPYLYRTFKAVVILTKKVDASNAG